MPGSSKPKAAHTIFIPELSECFDERYGEPCFYCVIGNAEAPFPAGALSAGNARAVRVAAVCVHKRPVSGLRFSFFYFFIKGPDGI